MVPSGWTSYIHGAENPLFQWGAKSGTTCGAAWTGVGSDPAFGAGGHYACDVGFGPSAWTAPVSGSGNAPAPGAWVHIALTYGGSTNKTEILYVNGQQNAVATGRTLAIAPAPALYIGAVFDATVGGVIQGGTIAIGALRMHDHVLSPAAVLNNFVVDSAKYVASASTSPTATASASSTATPSSTPPATATASITRSPTGSLTLTRTNTPPNTQVGGYICVCVARGHTKHAKCMCECVGGREGRYL